MTLTVRTIIQDKEETVRVQVNVERTFKDVIDVIVEEFNEKFEKIYGTKNCIKLQNAKLSRNNCLMRENETVSDAKTSSSDIFYL
jgi:hypothetical protein